jgi:hypothetical protein
MPVFFFLSRHMLLPLHNQHGRHHSAGVPIRRIDLLDSSNLGAEGHGLPIWRRAKTVTEALDQLCSYLTWRDTKAALLVFSRNKDFSNMLQSMWETVESHGQVKRGPSTESETRRRYVFARAGGKLSYKKILH